MIDVSRNELDYYHSYVLPTIPIENHAYGVHGITTQYLIAVNAPSWAQVWHIPKL